MKFLNYALVLPVALAFVSGAQAQSSAFYTVPFHNVEVQAASKIYVNYNFSSHTQTLVCSSDHDNETITSVEWSYKDATRKIDLPVTLQDGVNIAGHYADPEGKLIITNDFGSDTASGSIFVSCDYQKAK